MKISLTPIQRRIAVAAAIAVGVLLWVQASSVGIEESPWLLGVLVIAGLLVVAFAPNQPDAAKAAVPKMPQTELVPSHVYKSAYEVCEAEFLPIAERANANLVPNEMTAGLVVHVRVQAVKLAWIVGAMVLQAKYPGFRESQRFKDYGMLGGIEIRKHIRTMPGIAGPDAGTKSLELAAKEIAQCTVAMESAIQRLAKDQPHPMNPVYALIEREFPYAKATHAETIDVSERMDAAYGNVFRRATEMARQSNNT